MTQTTAAPDAPAQQEAQPPHVFDKTPWPLLLTLLNLPQLSIMISLQVSANRAGPYAYPTIVSTHNSCH